MERWLQTRASARTRPCPSAGYAIPLSPWSIAARSSVDLHLAHRPAAAEVDLGVRHRACATSRRSSATSSTGGGSRWPIGVPTSGVRTTRISVETGCDAIISSACHSPRKLAVVKAQDDVGDDPQAAIGEQPERAVEVLRGEVEVVDLADRLLGADDVEHHSVDLGVGETLRRASARRRRSARSRACRVPHGRASCWRRAAAAGTPPRRVEPPDTSRPSVPCACSRCAVSNRSVSRRDGDHALEHLGLAVVALQRARRAR